MPFTSKGIVPDLIMNPIGILGRMTMGHLIECLLGKFGAIRGHECDGTAFTRVNTEAIKDELEKIGYQRDGYETMYNGMTGEKMQTEVFIGPTFYQRLKHLVNDKFHCLTMDHDVLTQTGWKRYPELTMNDKVAVLKDNKLAYENPQELLYYPDYAGRIYTIANRKVNLRVTMEHRMWVSRKIENKWSDYKFEVANKIIGQNIRYKTGAIWDVPDYSSDITQITKNNKLPEWVWLLSARQAQSVINNLTNKTTIFVANENISSDDVQRLCLHAGWYGRKMYDGAYVEIDREIIEPTTRDIETVESCDYVECPVFCLRVSTGIFYVRRNGKACWTGNSRAHGPSTLLLHQPSEGRARGGGMRIGEMERDALIAHGMSAYLKEKLMDVSDIYSTWVCDKCGLFAQRTRDHDTTYVTEKDTFNCPSCNNKTHISKIVIPYAFKLLVQELMSMCIAPRIRTKNDKYSS